MGLLSKILESSSGSFALAFSIENKEVFEVSIKGKLIEIDVKNAFLALEMGLMHFIKIKKSGSGTLKRIKEKGYRIAVKYKGLEFDL